ncbi:MAG: hypothetical protein CL762_02180 [Chloroflexi bacterium]|nr:hypothetical protein [Chloroflexota bacterium]|tara:strand:- start:9 stop:905 length:897 start_codon:yes stop_codon:yes gene_type:complete
MDPVISIGLPVYNDEEFISETVNSILSQSFKYFELIIVDNHSEDGTYEILKKFESDKRVKVYRNSENLGMYVNFNLAFKYSKSNYFMWAGSHDILEENYLETIHEKIKEYNQDFSLIFTSVGHINEDGNTTTDHKKVGIERKDVNIKYYLDLPWKIIGSGDMVYGVFNKKYLSKTGIFSNVLWPDVLLIYEIFQYGKIIRIDQPLRKRRVFKEKPFSDWKEKYFFRTNRLRSRAKKNITFEMYIPNLIIFFKIIYHLGIKNNFLNVFRFTYSVYFASVFLWKHRIAFLLDLKYFLSKR